MNKVWKLGSYLFSKRYAYLITFTLVILASMLRIWPLNMFGSAYPFLTYYPVVIVVGIIGGFYLGIFATVLVCLTLSLTVLSPLLASTEPFIKTPEDWMATGFFIFNCVLISGLSELMHHANKRVIIEQKELEFTLNSGQLGYWNLNLDTHLADRSLLHDQIFGYNSLLPEWTYEKLLSHVHPDDRQFVDQILKNTVATGKSLEFECRIYRCNDPNIRWIWVAGRTLVSSESKHFLGVVRDITERKKTQLALENMIERYNALLEATPDSLIISNPEGHIIFSNTAVEKIFGYTSKEIIGKKIELLLPERYSTEHVMQREQCFTQPKGRLMGAAGLELYGRHKDGHEFPVEVSLSPTETAEGTVVLTAIKDITERKKTENTKAMLSALVEFSDEAIIGKNLRGDILSWNKASETLYGYTEAEAMGSSITMLFPKNRQDEFEHIIHRIARDEHIKHFETLRVHKDGHTIPVSLTISPIKNARGEVIGASTIAHDITKQKFIEQKLRYLAEHDALTGLIYRPRFEDCLELAISLAKRGHYNTAVCFLDIDNFKQINDQYGHSTGDLLLCAVIERIRKCIRDIDTLARLGGDEFGLILLNLNEEKDAVKIAKKIIQLFSEEFLIENKTLWVTISIGISLYPKDGDQLLKKADAAMYYAKKHGKNNFKLFDSRVY